MGRPRKKHEEAEEQILPEEVLNPEPEVADEHRDLPVEEAPREPEQPVEEAAAPAAVERSPEAMEAESHPAPSSIPAGRSSLADVPKVGIRVWLTKQDGSEVMCFYKKTRRMERGRWVTNARWCDAVSGKDIDWEPLYWRPLER